MLCWLITLLLESKFATKGYSVDEVNSFWTCVANFSVIGNGLFWLKLQNRLTPMLVKSQSSKGRVLMVGS